MNKPENLTTIGESRQDLQSFLPFMLKPSQLEPTRLPRPVHRLDRRTSGLIVVAKTKHTMQRLSRYFSQRNVRKTYAAVVFGDPSDVNKESGWQRIDYPIDGKPAVTDYLIHKSVPYINTTLSLVECRPGTGRFHQIRRHLSYCLGLPIVGDSKYDNGARFLRTDGMFLCSIGLDIPIEHRDQIKSTADPSCRFEVIEGGNATSTGRLKVSIQLPSKFRSMMSFSNKYFE